MALAVGGIALTLPWKLDASANLAATADLLCKIILVLGFVHPVAVATMAVVPRLVQRQLGFFLWMSSIPKIIARTA